MFNEAYILPSLEFANLSKNRSPKGVWISIKGSL